MKEYLTNEALKDICKSNFQLTKYAIKLGQFFIESGKEVQLKTILAEIKKHPDPEHVEKLRELAEIDRRAKGAEEPY